MASWRNWYRLESETFINIDLLRFIASFGIVVFHYGVHCFNLEIASDQVRLVFTNLNLFVDVFFVVSGIIIHSLYRNKIGSISQYTSFLRKRIARLVPLHYATFAFFVAVLIASGVLRRPVNPALYDLHCIPAQLTLTHAWGLCSNLTFNGPSWSVSAEFAVYLLTPILFLAGRRFLPVVVVLAGAWLINTMIPAPAGLSGLLPTRTFDFGVLRAIPAFLIGIWLSEHRDGAWSHVLGRVPLSVACVLFLLSPLVVTSPVVRLILAYILSATTYARDLTRRQPRITRTLAPLGRLTYSIYMLQSPVSLAVISFLAEDVLHASGPTKLAIVAVAIFAVLPLVSVVSLLLYELPLRNLIAGSRKFKPNERIAVEVAP